MKPRARITAGGRDHPVPGGMLETAENLRRAYAIGRDEQDELAVRSQERAGAAHEAGLLVHVYTFRDEPPFVARWAEGDPHRELARFYDLGVDGVFADRADTALAARAARAHPATLSKDGS